MPSTTSPSSPSQSSPSSPTMILTPETIESDLLAHLASTSALEDLHATLLCSLQRLGWTDKIRKLSLELLRAGRCERFDDVVEAVVASAQGRKHLALNDNEEDGDAYFENADVRVPKAVVEQGVRAIKDVLRDVIVLDDDPDHGSGKGDLDMDVGKSKGSKSGDQRLKNGDTNSAKKSDKKSKSGKDAR